jgi:GT2 family glycosyltransferase
MNPPVRCRIRHIDLAGAIPPLAVEPGYGLLLAVFWWRAVPLGQRLLLAGELPVPPAITASLAARSVGPALCRHLGLGDRELEGAAATPSVPALERLLAAGDDLDRLLPPEPAPEFARQLSVIVCTRDRPDDLRRCLASLVPTLPAGSELIVVDNAPETGTARRVVEGFPAVRRVPEARPGLSAARNAGIAAARGEILAFTDDDVEVHPLWARRILAAFADPAVACTTGLVLPAALESEAQLVFEFGLGGLGRGFVPRRFGPDWFRSFRRDCPPVWSLGAGANMAIRRSAIERVGSFDERLGAGASGCSEDSELWYRLLAAGLTCRYAPEAVVFHHHRGDWAALRAQAHEYMRGHVAALLVQFAHDGDRRNLLRLGVKLPTHFLRETARCLLRRSPYGRDRLLPAQITGCLRGLVALRRRAARLLPADALRASP